MIFLDLPYDILKFIGVFSLQSYSSKWTVWTYNVYRIFVIFLTSLVAVLMSVQLFVTTDLTMLARTIDIWTMYLSGIFKCVYMTIFNDKFTKLKTELIPIHSQGRVAYGESAADQFEVDFMKPTQKITWWYIYSGIIVWISLCANPLLSYPIGDRSELEYYNDPKSYPYCCWIPFTVHERWIFYIIYFGQCIAGLFTSLMYLGIDSFLFGAIYAIGGQIQILNLAVNNIEHKLAKFEKSSYTDRIIRYNQKQQDTFYLILRECLKHHILILLYITNIRTLFNLLLIADYLHGIISLSFTLFQLTISTNISETIGVFTFFVLSLCHQFLNNFFGEFIIQKQLSVSITLYNLPWWRADKKIRQLLTVMISRNINPILITGFYLYNLSYETFLKFVKALYTYYMVLRRFNT